MVAYNIFRKAPDTPLAWVVTAVNLDEAKKQLISLACIWVAPSSV